MKGILKVEVDKEEIGAAFMEWVLWNPDFQGLIVTLPGHLIQS